MYDIMLEQIKDEVTRLGVKGLNSAEEVDKALAPGTGTTLVFVNSTCGCAGGVARPALGLALSHKVKPDAITTVFASGDREATARAREYFTGMPPSSPSFALLRDGKLLAMVHRSDIERHYPQEVAQMITSLFDTHCAAVPHQS